MDFELEQSTVTFRLAHQTFALRAKHVLLITEMQKIHSIPNCSSPLIQGVVNLNGQLEPLLSLHTLLHLPKVPASPLQKMVLIKESDQEILFSIDQLIGMNLSAEASLNIALILNQLKKRLFHGV